MKKSPKDTLIVYFVGAITIISAAIFTSTLVRAAIYDPGATGMVYSDIQPGSVSDATSAEPGAGNSATIPATQTAQTAAAKPVQKTIPADYPARLLIPSLNINAPVQELGVNAKGNIGVPSNFTDVGWYSYGTPPGQPGTAVIDGHVDNGLALAGVFKHLSDIQPGAEIDIVTHGNTPLHFTVTGVQAYDYQNVPAQAIFGTESGASIVRLITCDGAWVNGGDTYDERLIVTARLVP